MVWSVSAVQTSLLTYISEGEGVVGGGFGEGRGAVGRSLHGVDDVQFALIGVRFDFLDVDFTACFSPRNVEIHRCRYRNSLFLYWYYIGKSLAG